MYISPGSILIDQPYQPPLKVPLLQRMTYSGGVHLTSKEDTWRRSVSIKGIVLNERIGHTPTTR